MKQVLVVSTSFPLQVGAVSGVFIARLVDSLSKKIKVKVITPASNDISGIIKYNNITIRTFGYAPHSWQLLAHQPGGIPVALKNHKWLYGLLPLFLLSMFICILRSSKNIEAIHANWAISAVIAGLVCKFKKIRLITTFRGDDITRAKKNKIDYMILLIALKLSDKVVTVSEGIGEWLKEIIKDKDKIIVIPNGVDPLYMKNTDEKSNRKNNIIKLISVGSLIERKGIDQLINALSEVTNKEKFQLTIVGEGEEYPRLLKMIKQFNLEQQVIFVGSKTPKEVSEMLKISDIFILTSHSEGRPNAVIEAMASGLPIIATNIQGVDELVENNLTGLLFDDGDIGNLSQIIELLINDSALRDKLGKSAYQFIKNGGFDWDKTADNYIFQYQLGY